MGNEGYKEEVIWAWSTVLVGLALAVIFWAGSHPINFVVMWGPQAAVLAVMFLIKARPAAIAGAALAFAGYLALFRWWDDEGGLAWLIYTFSLPGGLLGGIAVTKWLRKRDEWPGAAAALATAASVAAGLAIGQAYWMYAA